MENIRYLLHHYDPKKSLFVGDHIMSKQALKDMAEKVFPRRKRTCDFTATTVDSMTKSCLKKFATFVEGFDEFNRTRFYSGNLEEIFKDKPQKSDFLDQFSESFESAIGINEKQLPSIEYFIYRVKLFGIVSNSNSEFLAEKA